MISPFKNLPITDHQVQGLQVHTKDRHQNSLQTNIIWEITTNSLLKRLRLGIQQHHKLTMGKEQADTLTFWGHKIMQTDSKFHTINMSQK